MRYLLFLLMGLVMVGEFSLFAADNGAEKHPFNVHDLVTMKRISDQTVSPDGKWVVFTLRETDLDANKGRKNLWIVGTDGKGLRQLTATPQSNWGPCWSPDGKVIYFSSTRSGSVQIWRVAPEGGEALQVTNEPLDIGAFILSPDGKTLALTMEVFPGKCAKKTVAMLAEIKNRKSSGRIYDRLFIRHWDTWVDGRRSHVFIKPVDGGEARDLMKAMDTDTPTKPWGGVEELTFTPDGKAIIFTASNSGKDEPWSTNYDLYLVPLDGSAAPKSITPENKAWDTAPQFSPDGKTLAYLAMKRPGYEADRFGIMLKQWPDGPTKELVPNWDRSPSSITWAPDGKHIYAIAGNLGQTSLFVINVKKATVKTLVRDGKVKSVGFAGKKILYGLETMSSPVELYTIDKKGKQTTAVTAVNGPKLANIKLGEYEQFTFKGWNDETVYAYIVKPVDFDPAKKYPVAFLIHGGPQGSFGNKFHYRWNPQNYAGAGYACVMVDFHGSTGYGQAFTDAIRKNWGSRPFEDLQKGLAAALAKYPWMDGDRVGALGASYGGYMINWIAGNWPERFRCLVNHDGNLDERMAYYDTEELWFPEWEHGGTPWENPEGYNKHNPIDYIKNWKTPMLVIHGALDFRVVETQGISTFNALQRKGIPSKFLYFPDENHWVLKPHNSILWHDTVIGWLDQWLKKDK